MCTETCFCVSVCTNHVHCESSFYQENFTKCDVCHPKLVSLSVSLPSTAKFLCEDYVKRQGFYVCFYYHRSDRSFAKYLEWMLSPFRQIECPNVDHSGFVVNL